MIRPATPADRIIVETIVRNAYSVYLDRMDKPPGPMLDDYAILIGDGVVSVFDEAGEVRAFIVLLPQSDHLLLDNIAVRPDSQGRGLGRQLIAFAEAKARRIGLAEVRLYTHQTMAANILLYTRLGFIETGRGRENGYDRVFIQDIELKQYIIFHNIYYATFRLTSRGLEMPMSLGGSCRCGAVSFTVDSHTPYPYQRCYCSICRKSAGGGGYAINIMGDASTLKIRGKRDLGSWNAPIDGRRGSADRHYCKRCGCALWVSDDAWPELIHPFANVIDTALPKPPASVHLLLRDKASWVEPQIGPDDDCFDGYPELSIEGWHKRHGLWIE